MKKNLFLILISFITLSFISCCSNKNEVSVDDFGTKAKDLVGQEISITGVAQHICNHSGRKLFLTSPEGGETMVTVFTNPDMKPFDKETIGKTYTVKGVVKITNTIDEAYLQEWEAKVMESIANGEAQNEEGHCGTENKAAGIEVDDNIDNPQLAQIKALRQKIAENNGQPLVFYHVECNSFEIK
ncbi:MAG: hypothetical protein ACI358_09600 [Candidatus Limimorpha sp.]